MRPYYLGDEACIVCEVCDAKEVDKKICYFFFLLRLISQVLIHLTPNYFVYQSLRVPVVNIHLAESIKLDVADVPGRAISYCSGHRNFYQQCSY